MTVTFRVIYATVTVLETATLNYLGYCLPFEEFTLLFIGCKLFK